MARTNAQYAVAKWRTSATLQTVLGCILDFLFGMVILVAVTTTPHWNSDDTAALIFCLIGFFLGLLLLTKARTKRILLRTFRLYSSQFALDPSKSLPLLASNVGSSVDMVKRNVNKMLRAGFFGDAVLDSSGNYLIFAGAKADTSRVPAQGFGAANVVVQCSCCGAMNQIRKGAVGECEYCGSKLAGQ